MLWAKTASPCAGVDEKKEQFDFASHARKDVFRNII